MTAPAFAMQATPRVAAASAVPPFAHAELIGMATPIFERFMSVIETLKPHDWERPTYCTEWSVRDIVAHQAGAYESGTSFAAFRRQWIPNPLKGPAQLDDVNAEQIRSRASRTPAELIAELRDAGPRAIAARSRYPLLIRSLPIPIPPLGLCRAAYLTDHLYIRDTWIHTVDICHATGMPLTLNDETDARFVALIVRDLSLRLPKALHGRTVEFDLMGPSGGRFLVGAGAAAEATIRLETVDFNLRASERISAVEILKRAEISGDVDLGRRAVEHTVVLY